jgi:two-component system, NtrC family, sensor kinase
LTRGLRRAVALLARRWPRRCAALAVLAALLTLSAWGIDSGPPTQQPSGGAPRVLSLSSQPTDHLELSQWLEWLDESQAPMRGPFTVTAADGYFQPAPDGHGSLGFHAAPVWFRLRVANDSRIPMTWVLELGFMPTLAQLYQRDGPDLVLLSESGTSLSFVERPVLATRIAFHLTFEAMRTSTFFLKVQANDAIWARASLWSEPAFAQMVAARGLAQGLYYGLLLVMIVYNGFIYASTRERTYLLYVLYQLATLLVQAAIDKVAFQYLWPGAPGWAQSSEQLFGALSVVAALHFTLAFLEVQRYAPRLARALRVLAIAAGVFAAISVVTTESSFANVLGVFILGSLLMIAAAGVVAAVSSQANARFFLLGWTPLLVGAVLAVLASLGLFSNEIGYVAFKAGSAAEATILALALANRINLLRREREHADAELLAARTAQSTLLEQRVAARTEELSQTLNRLRLTQDKLIRQERLTSLAGMVAGMAHEVGNPLNFAQGGADVLRERIDGLAQTWQRMGERSRGAKGEEERIDHAADAERMSGLLVDAARAVGLVRAGLLRIGKIMTNLRGHMQLRALESHPTDLIAEIESTLAMVDDVLVRQGVTVIKHFTPLPPFQSRPGELNQVFMNIVLNACAAISGEGRLEITTCVQPDGGIEIQFADTGPGVPPAHREAIFEPFFSAHALGASGTGLGLYLAREIVARHGGRLELGDSACGACFVVRLPCTIECDKAPVRASSRNASASE